MARVGWGGGGGGEGYSANNTLGFYCGGAPGRGKAGTARADLEPSCPGWRRVCAWMSYTCTHKKATNTEVKNIHTANRPLFGDDPQFSSDEVFHFN